MVDRKKDYRKKTYSSSENIANAANEIGKVPPQARDLEEAVLGSMMMIDQDSLDESVGTLNGTISRIEDAFCGYSRTHLRHFTRTSFATASGLPVGEHSSEVLQTDSQRK